METKIYTVSTNNFTYDDTLQTYKAVFTAASIGFDGSKLYRVSKFLKNVSGAYHNVIVAYDINTSGDLTIYADEPIAGRLVLNTDN